MQSGGEVRRRAYYEEDESKDDDTNEAIEEGRGGGKTEVRRGFQAPGKVATTRCATLQRGFSFLLLLVFVNLP